MRKFLTLLLVLLLDAAVSVGGIFVYRAVISKKQAEPPTTQVQALHAVKNPYEDPNDPNTEPGKGTLFTTGTMTGYFLELKLAGTRCKVKYSDDGSFNKDLCNWASNKESTVTALVTFTDMVYNDLPVFVSANTRIKTSHRLFNPARSWFDILDDFTEKDDTALRIPAAYYNFLKYEMETNGKSMRDVRISLVWSGNRTAGAMGDYKCTARLYTKDIPIGSDDPTSPDFDLGAWAGFMQQVAAATGCGCDNVNWGTVKIVAIILGVVIGIGVVIKFFRWVFGGRT